MLNIILSISFIILFLTTSFVLYQIGVKIKKEKELKQHQDLLSRGYKLFEFRGKQTGTYVGGYLDGKRYAKFWGGKQYFKSFEELEKYINSFDYSLTFWREYD